MIARPQRRTLWTPRRDIYVPRRRIIRPRAGGTPRLGTLLATAADEGPPEGSLDPDETSHNLFYWLSAHADAPDPITEDPIGTWPDSGPAGRDFTQGTEANKPLLIEDYLGPGRHGAFFDGTNDALTNADDPTANSMHVFIVCAIDPSPGTAAQPALGFDATISGDINFTVRRSDSDGNWLAFNTTHTDIILSLDEPHVITWMKNPSISGESDTLQRIYVRADGVYGLDETNTSSTSTFVASFLGRSPGGTFFKGHIFEVAYFAGAGNCLSDAETLAVEQRLAWRWGITLP